MNDTAWDLGLDKTPCGQNDMFNNHKFNIKTHLQSNIKWIPTVEASNIGLFQPL